MTSNKMFKTEQEAFWAGAFGSEYIGRNKGSQQLASNLALFSRALKKVLMVCEYYNPTPVNVNYRGHSGRLFKRDFCGEILDRYPSLQLIDYGFVYHRDLSFPQDDITWFLMERR